MIGKILLLVLIGIPAYGLSTMYHPQPRSAAEPSTDPLAASQIWINYQTEGSQWIQESEWKSLQCYSDGSGWWCPAAGVGGGHMLRV